MFLEVVLQQIESAMADILCRKPKTNVSSNSDTKGEIAFAHPRLCAKNDICIIDFIQTPHNCGSRYPHSSEAIRIIRLIGWYLQNYVISEFYH